MASINSPIKLSQPLQSLKLQTNDLTLMTNEWQIFDRGYKELCYKRTPLRKLGARN